MAILPSITASLGSSYAGAWVDGGVVDVAVAGTPSASPSTPAVRATAVVQGANLASDVKFVNVSSSEADLKQIRQHLTTVIRRCVEGF